MRNRVLKPGDTHLMSPDEEYCRLIYERLWNTPDAFNLSVELYDKKGVRVRKSYKKITAEEEQGILSRVIGEGWEPVFVQNYEDWAIRIQKRPRSSSIYAASSLPTTREFLLRALIIALLLLTLGWLIGQAAWRADPARNPALLEPGTDADSDLDAGLEPGEDENEGEALDPDPDSNPGPDSNGDGEDELLGDAGDADDLDADSPQDDSLAEPDAAAEPDEPGGETPAAEPDEDSEAPAVGDADEDEDGPFEQAVRLAQQAVLGGRVADTPAEWEELADQWQQAADLMADVPEEDDRYDIAQDRVERYEANRAIALSEAEKLRDAE